MIHMIEGRPDTLSGSLSRKRQREPIGVIRRVESKPDDMILVRIVSGLALLVALMVAVGCGNYSNEDLEYLNALPQRQDMAVEVPRQASLTSAGSAAGWQRTFQVTHTMNTVADAFLSLIDGIRASYPTSRDGASRIWGPFPADQNNPGWRFEFRMTKSSTAEHFDYELAMLPPAGVVLSSGGASTQIIGGVFDAAGGLRVGTGHLVVSLDEARAAGVQLKGLEKLRTLNIDYDTGARTVTMTFENLAPVPPETDAIRATYDYQGQENGDGRMIFSWVSDAVPGPDGEDTLQIDTRWLASGSGREDTSVVAGDGAGAKALECWGPTFESTYKSQSWDPAGVSGDDSLCIPGS